MRTSDRLGPDAVPAETLGKVNQLGENNQSDSENAEQSPGECLYDFHLVAIRLVVS